MSLRNPRDKQGIYYNDKADTEAECGLTTHGDMYRGVSVETALLPKIKIEVVPLNLFIDTAQKALYTGNVGDEKMFIYDTENAIKVRAGEEEYDGTRNIRNNGLNDTICRIVIAFVLYAR